MSEGRLRSRIAAWEREQAWAPRYVADELDAAHEALRTAHTDATVWSARADAATDAHEAEQLRTAATQAQAEGRANWPSIVEQLQFADDARTAWRLETAVTRDLAERARHGAGIRGIDLDNPADRTTGQEWLDAEQLDRLAGDADRPITGYDVDEPRPAR